MKKVCNTIVIGDRKMTIVEIMKEYGSNQLCIELLERVRWSDGIVCPYCGSHKISKKFEHDRSNRHQCQDCHKSFTVLVGTIFHKARKLPQWFMILGLMLNAKKSKSSYEIARDIGMRQASVWEIMNKIREAMETKESKLLKGIVEMDETYIGGRPNGNGSNKRGRGTDKTPVVGVMERNGEVRTEVIDKGKPMNFKMLSSILEKYVNVIESHLMTDEYRGYVPMNNIIGHSVINHQKEYVNGSIHTNSIEGFWSLIKRAWYGSHHHYNRNNTHLYVAETSYVYNNRDNKNLFMDTLSRMVFI